MKRTFILFVVLVGIATGCAPAKDQSKEPLPVHDKPNPDMTTLTPSGASGAGSK